MKFAHVVAAAASLVLVLSAQSQVAHAESAEIKNIAVLDVQFVLRNAAATMKAGAEIDKIRAAYERQTLERQQELSELSQSIGEQRLSLSQEAYRQRTQELRQRTEDLQRDIRDQQLKIDALTKVGADKLEDAIVKIVDEIKRAKKLSVVLNRSAVVGGVSGPDITQEVLQRLNRALPAVALTPGAH